MKSNKLFKLLFGFLLLGVVFVSCDEGEDVEPITGEALFSYEANGMEITFINQSTVSGDVTYSWDFGDGDTSSEENPVHVYTEKGEYVVTFVVLDEQGGEHSIATKVKADKATRIDLNDDSFDDWLVVNEEKFIVSTGGELAGIVTSAKVDYDAENVYMYIEFEGTIEYGYFFDFYFDNDNDSLTGSRGWIYPDMGAEYLVEGQFTVPEALESVVTFYFNSDDQSAWAWADDKPFPTGFFTVGHTANLGSTAAFEMAFDRNKVPDLDNDVIQFGMFMSDPTSWADVGYAPDKAPEDGSAAGFTVDMR